MSRVRGKQLYVRPGAPLVAALDATDDWDGVTVRVNAITERYLMMVEELRPDFTEMQWRAIIARCEERGEVHPADFPEMETQGERIAVTETVERYWAHGGGAGNWQPEAMRIALGYPVPVE